MIGRVLRWLAGLDRSYFLALSAFIAAIIAAGFVAFAPTVELLDGSAMTLIEDSGAGVIVLILLRLLLFTIFISGFCCLFQLQTPKRFETPKEH